MADPFKKLYDDIAARKGEANAIGPYTGGNGRIDRAAELILGDDRFPKGGCRSLLDVGGATGNLGYLLRDHFLYRHVLEIAEACRAPSEAKGNTFTLQFFSDGVTMPYQEQTFDVITALDVIEHVLDPERFAWECFRVLRPGGAVLINTPNIQYWRHLHSLVVDGVFPHTSGDREVYHGGHIAFYNLQDLDELFIRRAGFIDSTMHVQGLTADPPPPVWGTLSSLPPHTRMKQLSYADLVFSCRKPS